MTREERIQEIVSISQKRLEEHYNAWVPKIAKERLERETELFLKKTDDTTLEQLLLFRELSECAERESECVFLAGTAANSIFIFLLGCHQPNPLPAHYYCPNCGHFEFGGKTFGEDLPEMECPHCDFPVLFNEGYSLPEEFAWGKKNRLDFEYRISSSFYDKAYAMIRDYYAKIDREVIPIWFGTKATPASDKEPHPCPSGAIILAPGKAAGDYPLGEYPTSGTAHELGLEYLLLVRAESLDRLHEHLPEGGTQLAYVSCSMPEEREIENLVKKNLCDVRELNSFGDRSKLSYRDLVNCYAAYHGTIFMTREKGQIPRERNYEFLKVSGIFCREDIFEEMLRFGADREGAFRVAEDISKGRYGRSINGETPLPEKIKKIAPHIGYLFPRGHIVERKIPLLMQANLTEESNG